jgi:hypothetical protein
MSATMKIIKGLLLLLVSAVMLFNTWRFYPAVKADVPRYPFTIDSR